MTHQQRQLHAKIPATTHPWIGQCARTIRTATEIAQYEAAIDTGNAPGISTRPPTAPTVSDREQTPTELQEKRPGCLQTNKTQSIHVNRRSEASSMGDPLQRRERQDEYLIMVGNVATLPEKASGMKNFALHVRSCSSSFSTLHVHVQCTS